MRLKHHDLVIDETDPFRNCKLERKQYAEILSHIISSYGDGFVLAINNEWGAGKTTFVKMWQQMLLNKKYGTVYFNAWENDFETNPLVAIMSELKTITSSVDEGKSFKSVLKKGSVIAKSVIPAVTKALAKKYAGADDITAEALEKAAEGVSEVLEEEIKEFANKKKAIADFRSELEKLIEGITGPKPIVFIIDELDRCRPDYSVEVLENLKHLFTVKGIVFVLSIDKNHLASAVKGYYGSDDINTEEYLRRFIDLEYTIPPPSNKAFISYLFDYYSFNDFFASAGRSKHTVFKNDASSLRKMAEVLFDHYPTTLRQQEKIFGLTRVCLNFFKENQYTFPNLLFLLVYFKLIRNELYKNIEANKLSIQELSHHISDIFLRAINDKYSKREFIILQAMLIHFYNNSQQTRMKLFEVDTERNKVLTHITTKLDSENGLAEAFGMIDRQPDYSDANLSFLIDKINLTSTLN